MKCPLCSIGLIDKDDGRILVCPNNHGTLIHAGNLKHAISAAINYSDISDAKDTTQQFACPFCATEMNKVNYNNLGIIIDSCSVCNHRWIDAHELTKINQRISSNKLDPQLILSVDSQLREPAEPINQNPKLVGFAYTRAFSTIFGGTYAMIAGHGLFGIIKGLRHSKFTRIVTVIVLTITSAAFYSIYLYFQD